MDCESTNMEPLEKIIKFNSDQRTPCAHLHATSSSPTLNIVQRIKNVMALEHPQTKSNNCILSQEVSENLSAFDLDGKEFVAVKALLDEISQWSSPNIPYQLFHVKSVSERRHAIVRAGVMIASLYKLPHCAIGIKIDSEASAHMQYHNLTELRPSIWYFVLTEISLLPPHIKTFLEPELSIEAKELKKSNTSESKMVKKSHSKGKTNDQVTC